MSNSISFPSRFLITPPIRVDESTRGYIVRVAERNASFSVVRPILSSLSSVTLAIPELVKLTGISSNLLESRGSSAFNKDKKVHGIRLGNITLPRNNFRLHTRQFCPYCLAIDGISRVYWELSLYSVCHKHGTPMVSNCSTCQKVISWDSPNVCSCGLHIGKMETKAVRSHHEKRFCKLLAQSVLRTIHYDNSSQYKPGLRQMIPVNWMLLLTEFIEHVLIPMFWTQNRSDLICLSQTDLAKLLVAMLGDEGFRNCLREVLFLHAAKEPMTMVQALSPGSESSVICRLLGGCFGDVPLHAEMWKYIRSVKFNRASSKTVRISRARKVDSRRIVRRNTSFPTPVVIPCA